MIGGHRPAIRIIFLHEFAPLLGDRVGDSGQIPTEDHENRKGVDQTQFGSIDAVLDDSEQVAIRHAFPSVVCRPDCESKLSAIYSFEGLVLVASIRCARIPA